MLIHDMDKIFIKGLKIDTIIGILDHERQFEQPLLVDVTLYLSLKKCAQSNNLELSINYAEVCKELTAFVQAQKAELLETLAEDCCQFILDKFKPHAVTLSMTKTQAVLNTQGVGVEITRTIED